MKLEKYPKQTWFRLIALTLCVSLIWTDISIGASLPAQPSTQSHALSPKDIVIPSELGIIQEYFQGQGSRLIIHLQDAHSSVETQEALAALVKYFHEKYSIKQAFVEGGEGELVMNEARTFPDPEIRNKVAREFLRTWQITGPEYYIISENPEFSLIGVENLKQYYTNREQFSEALKLGKSLDDEFRLFRTNIENLKSKILNPELREFVQWQDKLEKVLQSPTLLADYLRYLKSQYEAHFPAEPFTASYPSIAKAVSPDKKIEVENISIDFAQIFKELENLKNRVSDALIANEHEKTLLELLHILKYIEGALHLTLSRTDFEELEKNPPYATADLVRNKLSSLNALNVWKPEFEQLFEGIKPAIAFYRGAQGRDQVFIEKIEKELRHKERQQSLLITGGFHTPGITARLRQKNISYVVIQPAMKEHKPEDLEKYRKTSLPNPSTTETSNIPLEVAFGSPKDAGAAKRRDAFYRHASYLLIKDFVDGRRIQPPQAKQIEALLSGFGAEKSAEVKPTRIEEFKKELDGYKKTLREWEKPRKRWTPEEAKENVSIWDTWLVKQRDRFIHWGGQNGVQPKSKEAKQLRRLMRRFVKYSDNAAKIFSEAAVDVSEQIGLAYIQMGNFEQFIMGNARLAATYYLKSTVKQREEYFTQTVFEPIFQEWKKLMWDHLKTSLDPFELRFSIRELTRLGNSINGISDVIANRRANYAYYMSWKRALVWQPKGLLGGLSKFNAIYHHAYTIKSYIILMFSALPALNLSSVWLSILIFSITPVVAILIRVIDLIVSERLAMNRIDGAWNDLTERLQIFIQRQANPAELLWKEYWLNQEEESYDRYFVEKKRFTHLFINTFFLPLAFVALTPVWIVMALINITSLAYVVLPFGLLIMFSGARSMVLPKMYKPYRKAQKEFDRAVKRQFKSSPSSVSKDFPDRMIISEHAVKRRVSDEIQVLFTIADRLGLKIVLSGGTARDFAIAAMDVKRRKESFPRAADFDLVILDHHPTAGEYSRENYEKFQTELERELERLGYSKEAARRLKIDWLAGYFDGQRYVYENLLEAVTAGRAFTLSSLAVEKVGGDYVIFGSAEAMKDLDRRVLRIWPDRSISLGHVMTAKMMAKAALYELYGVTLERESRELLEKEVENIFERSKNDSEVLPDFLKELFLQSRTVDDTDESHRNRIQSIIWEFDLGNRLGKSRDELFAMIPRESGFGSKDGASGTPGIDKTGVSHQREERISKLKTEIAKLQAKLLKSNIIEFVAFAIFGLSLLALFVTGVLTAYLWNGKTPPNWIRFLMLYGFLPLDVVSITIGLVFDAIGKGIQKRVNVLRDFYLDMELREEENKQRAEFLKEQFPPSYGEGITESIREGQISKEPTLGEGGRIFEPEGEFFTLDKATVNDFDVAPEYNFQSGETTLFYKLDRTQTGLGRNRLKRLVLHPLLEPFRIRERQRTISELIDSKPLRNRIETGFVELGSKFKSQALTSLVSRKPRFKSEWRDKTASLIFPLALAVVAPLIFYVFSLPPVGLVSALYALFLPFVLWQRYRYEAAVRKDWKAIGVFVEKILPVLAEMKSPLAGKVHDVLKPALDENQNSGLRNFLLNPTPRRAHWAYKNKRGELEKILGAIGELESLFSQAQSAVDNLGYDAFPEIIDSDEPALSVRFDSKDLTAAIEEAHHPAIHIDQSVPNSIELYPGHSFMILTGVNMGGKSTYLRMVVLNMILAQIGSPVRASQMKLTPVKFMALVNIADDLAKGKSLFDVETDRLKEMIALALSDKRTFLFFDEMFRGTNPADRLLIKKSVIPYLAKLGILGIVSTHDLEVTELETVEHQPGIFNTHFEEILPDDRSTVSKPDYKLKEGPVRTTNAVRILERKGYPSEILADIRARQEAMRLRENGSGSPAGFGQESQKPEAKPPGYFGVVDSTSQRGFGTEYQGDQRRHPNLREDVYENLGRVIRESDYKSLTDVFMKAYSSELDYFIFMTALNRLFLEHPDYLEEFAVHFIAPLRRVGEKISSHWFDLVGDLIATQKLGEGLHRALEPNETPAPITPHVSRFLMGKKLHIYYLDVTKYARELGGDDNFKMEEEVKLIEELLFKEEEPTDFLRASVNSAFPDGDITKNEIRFPVSATRIQQGQTESIYLILTTLKDGTVVPFTLLLARRPEMSATVRAEYENFKPYRGDPHAVQVLHLASVEREGRPIYAYSSAFLNNSAEVLYTTASDSAASSAEPPLHRPWGIFYINSSHPTRVGSVGKLPDDFKKILAAYVRILVYFYDQETHTMIGNFRPLAGDANMDEQDFIFPVSEGVDIATSDKDRVRATLIAFRTKWREIQVPHFIRYLFDLSYLVEYSSGISGKEINVGEPYDRLIPESVFEGIRQGLIEKHGLKEGLSEAVKWLEAYLSEPAVGDSGIFTPDTLFTRGRVEAFKQSIVDELSALEKKRAGEPGQSERNAFTGFGAADQGKAKLPPGYFGVEASLSNIDGLEDLGVPDSFEKLKDRLGRILKRPAAQQKKIFEAYRGFLYLKHNQQVLEQVFAPEVLQAFRSMVSFDRASSSFPVEELFAVPYIEIFYATELRRERGRLSSEVEALDHKLSHEKLFSAIDSAVTHLIAGISIAEANRDQVIQELRLRFYGELLQRKNTPPRKTRIGLTTSRDGQQSNYALRFSGADQRKIIQLEAQLGAFHDLETWGGGVVQAALLKDTRGDEPEDPWYNLREQTAVLRQELEEALLPYWEMISDEDLERLFDRFRISEERRMLTDEELHEILSRYPSIAPDTEAGRLITDRYRMRQQMLLRGQYIVGLVPYPDSILELFIQTAYKNGVDIFRIFDALNDKRNIVKAIRYARAVRAKVQPVIHYSPDFPQGVKGYVELARELVHESGEALDTLVIKDAGGLLEPGAAFELVNALRESGLSVPIHVHTHDTRGNRQLTLLEAIRANGADFPIVVDLAVGKNFLSAPFGQPDLKDFLALAHGTNWAEEFRIDYAVLEKLEEVIAKDIVPAYPSSPVSSKERRDYVKAYMPGGMATNFLRQLKEQLKGYAALVLKEQGVQLFSVAGQFTEEGEQFSRDLLRLIREEMPAVTRDAGNISLVTPTSQWVGVQAFSNVVNWLVSGWIRFDKASASFIKTDQFPSDNRLKQYAPLSNDLRNYFLVWSQDTHLQNLYPEVNRDLVYRVFEDLKDESIPLDVVRESLRSDGGGAVDTNGIYRVLQTFQPIRESLGKTVVDFTVVRIKQKFRTVAAKDGDPLAARAIAAIQDGHYPRDLILEVIQGDTALNVPLNRHEIMHRLRRIERKPMVFAETPEDILLWTLFPQQVAYLLEKREFWLKEFQTASIGSEKREAVAQILERLGVAVSLGAARKLIRYADHWYDAFLKGDRKVSPMSIAMAHLKNALNTLRPFVEEGWPEAKLLAERVYEKIWVVQTVAQAADILNAPLRKTILPSGALQPKEPGLYVATEGVDEGERHIIFLGPLKEEVLVIATPHFQSIGEDKLTLLRNLGGRYSLGGEFAWLHKQPGESETGIGFGSVENNVDYQVLFGLTKGDVRATLDRKTWYETLSALEKKDFEKSAPDIRVILNNVKESIFGDRDERFLYAHLIISVDVDEKTLRQSDGRLVGLIVKHRGTFNILLPASRFHRYQESKDENYRKEFAADLLQAHVVFDLFDAGLTKDEASKAKALEAASSVRAIFLQQGGKAAIEARNLIYQKLIPSRWEEWQREEKGVQAYQKQWALQHPMARKILGYLIPAFIDRYFSQTKRVKAYQEKTKASALGDIRRTILLKVSEINGTEALEAYLHNLSALALEAEPAYALEVLSTLLSIDLADLLVAKIKTGEISLDLNNLYVHRGMDIAALAKKLFVDRREEVIKAMKDFSISFLKHGDKDIKEQVVNFYRKFRDSFRREPDHELLAILLSDEEIQDQLLYNFSEMSNSWDVNSIAQNLDFVLNFMMQDESHKWKTKLKTWIPQITRKIKGPLAQSIIFVFNGAEAHNRLISRLIKIDPIPFNDNELLDALIKRTEVGEGAQNEYPSLIIIQTMAEELAKLGQEMPAWVYERFIGRSDEIENNRYLNYYHSTDEGELLPEIKRLIKKVREVEEKAGPLKESDVIISPIYSSENMNNKLAGFGTEGQVENADARSTGDSKKRVSDGGIKVASVNFIPLLAIPVTIAQLSVGFVSSGWFWSLILQFFAGSGGALSGWALWRIVKTWAKSPDKQMWADGSQGYRNALIRAGLFGAVAIALAPILSPGLAYVVIGVFSIYQEMVKGRPAPPPKSSASFSWTELLRGWRPLAFGLVALGTVYISLSDFRYAGFVAGLSVLIGAFTRWAIGNPNEKATALWSKQLLNAAIVFLGAGLNVHQIWQLIGFSGIVGTAAVVSTTFIVGLGLAKLFKTDWIFSVLFITGMSICGGSAILAASVALGLQPDKNDEHKKSQSSALAIILVLNTLALWIFPFIAHQFHLLPSQAAYLFAWAIQDTNSVVESAHLFDLQSVELATTLKVMRASLITLTTLFISLNAHRLARFLNGGLRTPSAEERVSKSWRLPPPFIFGFILVAALTTFIPPLQPLGNDLKKLSKPLLTMAFFFVGSGFKLETFKKVLNKRILAQSILAWFLLVGPVLAYVIHLGRVSSAGNTNHVIESDSARKEIPVRTLPENLRGSAGFGAEKVDTDIQRIVDRFFTMANRRLDEAATKLIEGLREKKVNLNRGQRTWQVHLLWLFAQWKFYNAKRVLFRSEEVRQYALGKIRPVLAAFLVDDLTSLGGPNQYVEAFDANALLWPAPKNNQLAFVQTPGSRLEGLHKKLDSDRRPSFSHVDLAVNDLDGFIRVAEKAMRKGEVEWNMKPPIDIVMDGHPVKSRQIIDRRTNTRIVLIQYANPLSAGFGAISSSEDQRRLTWATERDGILNVLIDRIRDLELRAVYLAFLFGRGEINKSDLLNGYRNIFAKKDLESQIFILRDLFDKGILFNAHWIWPYLEPDEDSALFAEWFWLLNEKSNALRKQVVKAGGNAAQIYERYGEYQSRFSPDQAVRLLRTVGNFEMFILADDLEDWYLKFIEQLAARSTSPKFSRFAQRVNKPSLRYNRMELYPLIHEAAREYFSGFGSGTPAEFHFEKFGDIFYPSFIHPETGKAVHPFLLSHPDDTLSREARSEIHLEKQGVPRMVSDPADLQKIIEGTLHYSVKHVILQDVTLPPFVALFDDLIQWFDANLSSDLRTQLVAQFNQTAFQLRFPERDVTMLSQLGMNALLFISVLLKLRMTTFSSMAEGKKLVVFAEDAPPFILKTGDGHEFLAVSMWELGRLIKIADQKHRPIQPGHGFGAARAVNSGKSERQLERADYFRMISFSLISSGVFPWMNILMLSRRLAMVGRKTRTQTIPLVPEGGYRSESEKSLSWIISSARNRNLSSEDTRTQAGVFDYLAGEVKRSLNSLLGKHRITAQNVVDGVASFDHLENKRNRNPRSSKAGLTVADIGVNTDVLTNQGFRRLHRGNANTNLLPRQFSKLDADDSEKPSGFGAEAKHASGFGMKRWQAREKGIFFGLVSSALGALAVISAENVLRLETDVFALLFSAAILIDLFLHLVKFIRTQNAHPGKRNQVFGGAVLVVSIAASGIALWNGMLGWFLLTTYVFVKLAGIWKKLITRTPPVLTQRGRWGIATHPMLVQPFGLLSIPYFGPMFVLLSMALAPVFSAVLERMLSVKRFGKMQWIGGFITVGAMILSRHDQLGSLASLPIIFVLLYASMQAAGRVILKFIQTDLPKMSPTEQVRIAYATSVWPFALVYIASNIFKGNFFAGDVAGLFSGLLLPLNAYSTAVAPLVVGWALIRMSSRLTEFQTVKLTDSSTTSFLRSTSAIFGFIFTAMLLADFERTISSSVQLLSAMLTAFGVWLFVRSPAWEAAKELAGKGRHGKLLRERTYKRFSALGEAVTRYLYLRHPLRNPRERDARLFEIRTVLEGVVGLADLADGINHKEVFESIRRFMKSFPIDFTNHGFLAWIFSDMNELNRWLGFSGIYGEDENLEPAAGQAIHTLYPKLKLAETFAARRKLAPFLKRIRKNPDLISQLREKTASEFYKSVFTKKERTFLAELLDAGFWFRSPETMRSLVGFDHVSFLLYFLYYTEAYDQLWLQFSGIARASEEIPAALHLDSASLQSQLTRELGHLGRVIDDYFSPLRYRIFGKSPPFGKYSPDAITDLIVKKRSAVLEGASPLIERQFVELLDVKDPGTKRRVYHVPIQIAGQPFAALFTPLRKDTFESFKEYGGHIALWTVAEVGARPWIFVLVPWSEYRERSFVGRVREHYDSARLAKSIHRKGDDKSTEYTLSTVAPEIRKLIRAEIGTKKRILSIGPGSGLLERQLAKAGYQVSAVELSEVLSRKLGRKGNIHVFTGDAQHLERVLPMAIPADERKKFDAIVLSESLGYFDGEELMQKLGAFLKHDGKIIITTYPGAKRKPIWGYRFTPLSELAHWLSEAGFELRTQTFYRLAPDWIRMPVSIAEVDSEESADIYMVSAGMSEFARKLNLPESPVSFSVRQTTIKQLLARQPEFKEEFDRDLGTMLEIARILAGRLERSDLEDGFQRELTPPVIELERGGRKKRHDLSKGWSIRMVAKDNRYDMSIVFSETVNRKRASSVMAIAKSQPLLPSVAGDSALGIFAADTLGFNDELFVELLGPSVENTDIAVQQLETRILATLGKYFVFGDRVIPGTLAGITFENLSVSIAVDYVRPGVYKFRVNAADSLESAISDAEPAPIMEGFFRNTRKPTGFGAVGEQDSSLRGAESFKATKQSQSPEIASPLSGLAMTNSAGFGAESSLRSHTDHEKVIAAIYEMWHALVDRGPEAVRTIADELMKQGILVAGPALLQRYTEEELRLLSSSSILGVERSVVQGLIADFRKRGFSLPLGKMEKRSFLHNMLFAIENARQHALLEPASEAITLLLGDGTDLYGVVMDSGSGMRISISLSPYFHLRGRLSRWGEGLGASLENSSEFTTQTFIASRGQEFEVGPQEKEPRQVKPSHPMPLRGVLYITRVDLSGFGVEAGLSESGFETSDDAAFDIVRLNTKLQSEYKWIRQLLILIPWLSYASSLVGYITHPIINEKRIQSQATIARGKLRSRKNLLANAAPTVIFAISSIVLATASLPRLSNRFIFGDLRLLREIFEGLENIRSAIENKHNIDLLSKSQTTQPVVSGFGANIETQRRVVESGRFLSGDGAFDIRRLLGVRLLSLLLAPWLKDLLRTWYQISSLVGQNTQPSINKNTPRIKAITLNQTPSPKKNWLAKAEVTVILLKSMNVLATKFFLFPSNSLIGFSSLAVVQLLRERESSTVGRLRQLNYDEKSYTWGSQALARASSPLLGFGAEEPPEMERKMNVEEARVKLSAHIQEARLRYDQRDYAGAEKVLRDAEEILYRFRDDEQIRGLAYLIFTRYFHIALVLWQRSRENRKKVEELLERAWRIKGDMHAFINQEIYHAFLQLGNEVKGVSQPAATKWTPPPLRKN